MTTPDLIARREAVAKIIAGFGPCRPNETWGPATQAHWRDSLAKADAILSTLEASDADTVRVATEAMVQTVAVALFNDWRARHGYEPMTWEQMEEWHRDAHTAVAAMLTAAHPKPEPVETQREASRSPVSEERGGRHLAVAGKPLVSVPLEPTEAMLRAGANCIDWCRDVPINGGHEAMSIGRGVDGIQLHAKAIQNGNRIGTSIGEDVRDAWAAMIAAALAEGPPQEGA